MTKEILLAGFGGQGILFAGKLLAYFALLDGKEVSWLPSYGPAMRGGTCNCSVCIDDDHIGSPMVLKPDVLFVMNQPSYDKFIGTVKTGGIAIIDETLVKRGVGREDISYHYIQATKLALDNGLKGMANIIMLGKLLNETDITAGENIQKAMEKSIPLHKVQLIELNMKALELGKNN
ncbi:MAG: 2-oxoacid:acceptor oxidoreductase family protein [Eubacterium sp.]|jgi:2-oxoglutarate ferredoxin oxidoreductase subunit gamma|nr:2-oxoacid:acceptor oxidoreductase family protein [Eubacterium sp.]